MDGRQKDFAGAGDLSAHVRDDARTVHGIWSLVRDSIEKKPCYFRFCNPTALSLTMNNTEQDYDFTSATSARAIAVLLELRQSGTGKWVYSSWKKKGAANWDHDGGLAVFDYATGDPVKVDRYSEWWIQRVDSEQRVTYKIHCQGTTVIYLLGWIEQEG